MGHRHAVRAPFRPLLLLAATVGLLLGLLGMNTLCLDHAGTGPAGAMETTGHAGSHATEPGTGAPGRHLADPPTPLADDSGSHSWCGNACGLEMAVAGMCIVALAAVSVLAHLAARALRPVPGRGLAAPPPLWIPFDRLPVPPSLVQLSISRT